MVLTGEVPDETRRRSTNRAYEYYGVCEEIAGETLHRILLHTWFPLVTILDPYPAPRMGTSHGHPHNLVRSTTLIWCGSPVGWRKEVYQYNLLLWRFRYSLAVTASYLAGLRASTKYGDGPRLAAGGAR
jgi:hypothetical protein